jgi:Pvc16 N-terminal domain
MSGHAVLADATLALRAALFQALQDRKIDIGEIGTAISLAPPPREAGGAPLSLWLYFVSENEHTKNRPPILDRDGTTKPAPLALTLYYLITPRSPTNITEAESVMQTAARVLGAVLQGFHEQPIIPLRVPSEPATLPEPDSVEELHLSLCRLSVEELTRIWDALDCPYRLSVCFKVNIVRIERRQATRDPLVRTREFISGRLKENVG